MSRFTDDLDRAIVRLLEEDGRLPNLEVARRLGVSESTIRKRIARLIRQSGMRISATLDGGARLTEMLFLINTEAGSRVAAAERLAALPDVQYVAVTTGGYDVVIRAAFRSDADALDFLVQHLEGSEGVRSVQTGHVLKNLKMPGALPSPPPAAEVEPARMAALDCFVQAAARAPDLDSVLNLACESVLQALNADRIAIFTVGDNSRQRPVHRASRGLSAEYLTAISARITPDIGVGLRVADRHLHIYVEDASNSPLLAGVQDLVRKEGYCSLLFLPLLFGTELVGMLSLYSDSIRHYSEGEIALAQAFADQLAIADVRLSRDEMPRTDVAPMPLTSAMPNALTE